MTENKKMPEELEEEKQKLIKKMRKIAKGQEWGWNERNHKGYFRKNSNSIRIY